MYRKNVKGSLYLSLLSVLIPQEKNIEVFIIVYRLNINEMYQTCGIT